MMNDGEKLNKRVFFFILILADHIKDVHDLCSRKNRK